MELGGGSIRIHNPQEQAHVLKILGEETEELVSFVSVVPLSYTENFETWGSRAGDEIVKLLALQHVLCVSEVDGKAFCVISMVLKILKA